MKATGAIPSEVDDRNLVSHVTNHENAESMGEPIDKEEIRIMKDIAATGKFRHDWDTLKTLLLSRLKKVLSEYPESQTVANAESHENSVPGETYPELVQRLEGELLSFIEGPPFTLQRICEILLSPKDIYPKLSKLALALEKNLSVTSTLSISPDPDPQTMTENPAQPDNEGEEIQRKSSPIQNGVEKVESDADEEMIEAEAVQVKSDSDMGTKVDNAVEMEEEKTAEASESSSEPIADSNMSTENVKPVDTNEQ